MTGRDSLAPAPAPAPARRDDDLVLLANEAMRARRRPAAILLVWAYESVLALLIGWPIAAIARAAYAGNPRGDAPLWDPGGRELLDFLWSARAAAPAVLAITALVVFIAAILGLIPIGALLASITFVTRDKRPPHPHQALARAVRAFWPMLLLLLLVLAFQGLILGIGTVIAGATTSALVNGAGDARADQVGWLVLALFIMLIAAIGVAHDLARAALIRFRLGALGALHVGAKTLRRSFFTTLWSWAWRGFAGLVMMAIGSAFAERIGGRGGAALVALFALHQLIVAFRVALRASWLAKAARTVDAANRLAFS